MKNWTILTVRDIFMEAVFLFFYEYSILFRRV